jgi:hypothetical protein
MEFEDQPWTLVISVCAPRIFIAWKFLTLLGLRQSHQLLHDNGREDFLLKSSHIFVPSLESPDCHTHRFGISFLQNCFVNLRSGTSYFNVHELGEQCLDNPQEVPLAVWILPCRVEWSCTSNLQQTTCRTPCELSPVNLDLDHQIHLEA